MLTSGNHTIEIKPGKTVQFASEAVCELIPLRATTADGKFLENYTDLPRPDLGDHRT